MLSAVASRSQQPPRQRPGEEDVVRISTNLVQIDAVVVDKDGNRVTDLKPGEVQIFEDDRQQKITHFSYISGASAETAVTATPAPKNNSPAPPLRLKREQVRRTIAIVVDD